MKEQGDFQRVLGPFSATCIVVGAIVGIGIFFTPKNVALLTGSGQLALLAWAVGGAIALLGALTFAELGGMYPRTGGQYEILRDAYAAPIGFLYVFCNATIIQAGAITIIAYYSALNFGFMIRGEMIAPHVIVAIASVMIVGLSLANIRGVKWGAAVQITTVVAKLLTLAVITLLAVFAERAEAVSPSDPPAGASGSVFALVFAGLVPVLFSYGGWQHALWIGGEVKQPERNVPRAIILGVVTVTVAYLLANWAYLSLLGYAGLVASEAVAAEAVGIVWPEVGPRLIAGAIALSGFGVLNAQLLSGPRLVCGMARDGKFFAPFAAVHSRWGTPVASIVLLGGLGLLLLLAAGEKRVDQVLTGVVLVDSVFFLLTGLALILLRMRSDSPRPPVRIPLFPLAPVLFVIGEAAVMVGAFLDEKYRSGAYIGLIWIVAAAICYAVFFRGRKPAA